MTRSVWGAIAADTLPAATRLPQMTEPNLDPLRLSGMAPRTMLGPLCLAALAALAAYAAVPAAGASAGADGGPVTRSAHVPYGGCPARDITLRAMVQHRSYAPGQRVTFEVSLHNNSALTCQPTTGAPRALTSGLIGPCSRFPVVIDNARGFDVYPGPQAYLCPDLRSPTLQPHQTLSATGTWDQRQGSGRPALRATPVPRGTYHLMVAQTLSVPIVLR